MLRNTYWTCIALTAVTLGISGLARAALEIVEEAYELSLTQVLIPADERGSVVIRACDTCASLRLQVDARTMYYLAYRTPPVSLAEMNRVLANVSDRRNTSVFVMYEPESLVVTRIVLGLADR